MAFYLRPPKHALGGLRGDGVYVNSAPLVMHDRCARDNGACGSLTDGSSAATEHSFKLREAFTRPMGAGFDLCWDFAWSYSPDAAPCYWCGVPTVGQG